MLIDGGLRPMFHKSLHEFHWQSIESGFMGRGIPDSNYCRSGVEGWIEFKKTSGWKVGLRPEQVGWLLRRSRAGGRTFVAVRQEIGATDRLWLFPGSLARELKEFGLRGPATPLGSWPGGPRAWDWLTVSLLLRQ